MGDNDDKSGQQLNIGDLEKSNEDLIYSNFDKYINALDGEITMNNSKGEIPQTNRFTIVENNFSEEPSDYKDDSVNISNNKELIPNLKNNLINFIKLKIILVGDVAVGKTSIIGRYINNKFYEEYKCTVQAEQQTKILKEDANTSLKLNIWDTVGQEKFRSITRQYYRDCQGAIIVFDITKKKTFDYIFTWIKEIQNYGNEDTVIIILGNKSDLSEEREITQKEINDKLNGEYLYFEVSAKNGNNILMAFDKMKKLIMENRKIIEAKNKLNQNKYNNKEVKRNNLLKDFDKGYTEKNKKCC